MDNRPEPTEIDPAELDPADAPPRMTEREIMQVLDESEADEAAGRTVPWDQARERFLAMIADMQAEQAKRRA